MSESRERYSLGVYLRFFELESKLGRTKPRKINLQQLSGVRNWPSCGAPSKDTVVEGSGDTPLPPHQPEVVKEVSIISVKPGSKKTLYSKNCDRSTEFKELVGRRARRHKREEEFVERRSREIRNHIHLLQPQEVTRDGQQAKVQSLKSKFEKIQDRGYNNQQQYNGEVRSPSIQGIAHRVFLRSLESRSRNTWKGRRAQMAYLEANTCRRSFGCKRGKHQRGSCCDSEEPSRWLLCGSVRFPKGHAGPIYGDFLGCGREDCTTSHGVPWEGRNWLVSEPGKEWLLSPRGQQWIHYHSPAGWERCILGGNCWLGDGTRPTFSKRCPCMLKIHRIAR